jgi:hypothetical protein
MITRYAVGVLVSVTLSTTWAQDERALELLEPLRQESAEQAPLETFDYTLHYTIYSDSTAKAAENYLRFAADIRERRLFTERVIGRTPNFRLVSQGGEATAYDLRADESFIPPPELLTPFERWFEQVPHVAIREEALQGARYLGEVSYSELAVYEGDERRTEALRGEAVAVTATVPDFLGTSLGSAPVRLIFGEAGAHLASVYTVEGQEQLVTYNDPGEPQPLARYLNAHLYQLGTQTPFLEARTRLQQLTLNEPLDPDLFDGSGAGDE